MPPKNIYFDCSCSKCSWTGSGWYREGDLNDFKTAFMKLSQNHSKASSRCTFFQLQVAQVGPKDSILFRFEANYQEENSYLACATCGTDESSEHHYNCMFNNSDTGIVTVFGPVVVKNVVARFEKWGNPDDVTYGVSYGILRKHFSELLLSSGAGESDFVVPKFFLRSGFLPHVDSVDEMFVEYLSKFGIINSDIKLSLLLSAKHSRMFVDLREVRDLVVRIEACDERSWKVFIAFHPIITGRKSQRFVVEKIVLLTKSSSEEGSYKSNELRSKNYTNKKIISSVEYSQGRIQAMMNHPEEISNPEFDS